MIPRHYRLQLATCKIPLEASTTLAFIVCRMCSESFTNRIPCRGAG